MHKIVLLEVFLHKFIIYFNPFTQIRKRRVKNKLSTQFSNPSGTFLSLNWILITTPVQRA